MLAIFFAYIYRCKLGPRFPVYSLPLTQESETEHMTSYMLRDRSIKKHFGTFPDGPVVKDPCF